MAYTKTTWVDGSAPAISASNLNKIETGIYDSLRQDGTTAMSGQLVVTSGSATTPSIAASGDSNTGLFFPTADTIAFGEGGAEAMRITSAGNVGIGTTSFNIGSYDAGSKFLELESSKYPVIELSSTNTVANNKILGVIGFMNNGTGVASKSSAQIVSLQDGTDGMSPGGRLEFYTRADAGSLTERIRITSAGNVGIGTSSPSGKLHVGSSSDTNTYKLFVEGSNSADVKAVFVSSAKTSRHLGIDVSEDNFFIGRDASVNDFVVTSQVMLELRSEERRVGKECRL